MGVLERSMSWEGGMRFEGTGVYGLRLVTDTTKAVGGGEDGFSPSELLLFSVIACTGMDVVSILKKMRQNVTGLTIDARATQPDEYPKPFQSVALTYTFTGDQLERERVERAVELSQTKYCMVSQTISGVANVTYEIKIN